MENPWLGSQYHQDIYLPETEPIALVPARLNYPYRYRGEQGYTEYREELG